MTIEISALHVKGLNKMLQIKKITVAYSQCNCKILSCKIPYLF